MSNIWKVVISLTTVALTGHVLFHDPNGILKGGDADGPGSGSAQTTQTGHVTQDQEGGDALLMKGTIGAMSYYDEKHQEWKSFILRLDPRMDGAASMAQEEEVA